MGRSTGSLWKSRQSCGIFDVLTSVFVQRSVRADLQSISRRNDSCRWFLFKVYTLLQPLRGLRCSLTQFTWFTFDTLDSEERHPCGAHGMGLVQRDERSSGRHWVEIRDMSRSRLGWFWTLWTPGRGRNCSWSSTWGCCWWCPTSFRRSNSNQNLGSWNHGEPVLYQWTLIYIYINMYICIYTIIFWHIFMF